MRFIPLRVTKLTMGAALALPLALMACGSSDDNKEELAMLDDNLTGKPADAVTGALQDQIIVDPALAANANAVRDAGSGPASGKDGSAISTQALDRMPLMNAPEPRVAGAEDCDGCAASRADTTLGARAREQSVPRGAGACDAKLTYDKGWATRMPPEFPVYPKGRIQEAAGVDGGVCHIRVVSYTTSAPLKNVVDYYYTRARKSGYSAEYMLRDGEHVLGGVRDRDDGAYFITFQRNRDGGTAIDLVANNGR